MRKKASGFYADSLEMLLDTMCNVLGGILFITLTLAALTRQSSSPEAYQQQAVQLTNEMASVTSSNSIVEARIQWALEQLQTTQPNGETNQMHLPNVSRTRKNPWNIIIRYGQVYSVYLAPQARDAKIKNTRALDWRGSSVEPISGKGDDPAHCVETLAGAFRQTSQTNYYFAFWVYEDSFATFNRAKELAFNSGMEYGWEPLSDNARLSLTGLGPGILPQN